MKIDVEPCLRSKSAKRPPRELANSSMLVNLEEEGELDYQTLEQACNDYPYSSED